MQPQKRRRVAKCIALMDDNLSSILDFLPTKDYSNFTLVSKQFHQVFYNSPKSTLYSVIIDIKNRLAHIKSEDRVSILQGTKKQIDQAISIANAEVENINIYQRMLKGYLGDQVKQFEEFISNIQIRRISKENLNVGEGARSEEMEIDHNGVSIKISHDAQGDYYRTETMCVSVQSEQVFYFRSDDRGSDGVEFNSNGLRVLPYHYSSKQWCQLFWILLQFFLCGTRFGTEIFETL
jgi:hypothetical protein